MNDPTRDQIRVAVLNGIDEYLEELERAAEQGHRRPNEVDCVTDAVLRAVTARPVVPNAPESTRIDPKRLAEAHAKLDRTQRGTRSEIDERDEELIRATRPVVPTCEHCDDTGQVWEPEGGPTGDGYSIRCENCQRPVVPTDPYGKHARDISAPGQDAHKPHTTRDYREVMADAISRWPETTPAGVADEIAYALLEAGLEVRAAGRVEQQQPTDAQVEAAARAMIAHRTQNLITPEPRHDQLMEAEAMLVAALGTTHPTEEGAKP